MAAHPHFCPLMTQNEHPNLVIMVQLPFIPLRAKVWLAEGTPNRGGDLMDVIN